MNPKVMIVPYTNISMDQVALDYALELAKIYDSHIEGWHIVPDPENIVMPYGAYGAMPVYPEASIIEVETANEKSRIDAEKRFFMSAEKAGVKSVSFHSATGWADKIISRRGRVSDLIVMARTAENINYTNSINGALFGSGRPVLLVPLEKTIKNFNKKILIAWNGSRESGQAVSFALPYLVQSKIWIFADQENKNIPLSAEDLKNYLKHHGLQAEILTVIEEGLSVGDSILNTAKMLGTGMIVMGAWSHSRMTEYILGGVTDFMLHNVDCPVFMAH